MDPDDPLPFDRVDNAVGPLPFDNAAPNAAPTVSRAKKKRRSSILKMPTNNRAVLQVFQCLQKLWPLVLPSQR